MRSLLTDLLLQRLANQQDGALNKRLYDCIRLAILDGAIAAGERLPSSRDLAQQLSLSRNTVLTAYEQLLAEGYIDARKGSGTFVTEQLPDGNMQPVSSDSAGEIREPKHELSRRGMHLLGYAAPPPANGARLCRASRISPAFLTICGDGFRRD